MNMILMNMIIMIIMIMNMNRVKQKHRAAHLNSFAKKAVSEFSLNKLSPCVCRSSVMNSLDMSLTCGLQNRFSGRSESW